MVQLLNLEETISAHPKFLWMCRIGGLDERDFMNHNSEFRIDSDAAPKWMNSVLYRLSYYRYGQMNIGIVFVVL